MFSNFCDLHTVLYIAGIELQYIHCDALTNLISRDLHLKKNSSCSMDVGEGNGRNYTTLSFQRTACYYRYSHSVSQVDRNYWLTLFLYIKVVKYSTCTCT